MTNLQRGESLIQIDGRSHTLRLSLGALAEIESQLGVEGFKPLSERLGRLSASDLVSVLTALLRAGGADEAEALAAGADPHSAARAVAACFKANLS